MAHFVILSTCGTGNGIRTRKIDVIAPTDFKSVFCTNSNIPAYGCVRLDSNQRPPAYEAGDLDLLSTPQYWAVSVHAQEPILSGGFSSEVKFADTIIGKILLWIIFIVLATSQPRGHPLGFDH